MQGAFYVLDATFTSHWYRKECLYFVSTRDLAEEEVPYLERSGDCHLDAVMFIALEVACFRFFEFSEGVGL